MKKLPVIFALLIVVLTAQIAAAQSQKAKDRAAFISNTRLLEKKPFDPAASSAREWGFKWVVDTDEVTVGLCTEMMKLIPEKKNKFKSELFMQFTFGMALFQLENPDKNQMKRRRLPVWKALCAPTKRWSPKTKRRKTPKWTRCSP